jgi:hypothetical protein
MNRMARAILVLRQYPWTLIAAVFLFVCSLALAASTMGIIRPNGGDDQGSGMGGTGKQGPFNDSGFGGTGGPSPFLGDNDNNDEQQNPDDDLDPMGNIPGASWMPRETETAEIPADIQPLIDIQQSPLLDPLRQHNPENGDTLRILDPAADSHLPAYERKQLQMAESGNMPAPEQSLEIHLNVPKADTLPEANIQQFSLEQLARSTDSDTPEAEAPQEQALSDTPHSDSAIAAEQSRPEVDAEREMTAPDTEIPVIDAINLANGQDSAEERELTREQLPDRIQRPDLPPMQRVRPAVSRPAITAPRPQPMHI